jgi:hypothetical protein
MADHPVKEQPTSTPGPATPPGEGRQDHEAMRVDAMLPVAGPAGANVVAAGGGLEVPGGEPQSSEMMTMDLSVTNPSPELIPGAYERNTAAPRQPGAIGGRFNGADNTGVDLADTMDARTAEEHRREGGGDYGRTTEAHHQRSRRR